MIHRIFKYILITLIVLFVLYLILASREAPKQIEYGVSFSKLHSDELNLNWKEVYRSILDDLNVAKIRLSAHWPMIEPENNEYDFSVIDYQINEAKKNNAEVILAIGRRLPVWPECHEPDWAKKLSWEDRKKEITEYIEKVILRYRYHENIKYWQIENEPFLTVYAKENCEKLDREFLKEEISLVKKLDSTRPVLVTDSGNLGGWYGAWNEGDAFGTSLYLYLWNPQFGKIKSFLWPGFYRAKTAFLELTAGKKESFLIELSLEPFLLQPIVNTPYEVQLDRMDANKFNKIIEFAKKTGFEKQYLWGVEWWYYMKENDYPEFWDKAKEIFD